MPSLYPWEKVEFILLKAYCLEIVLEKANSFCVPLWELMLLSYGRILSSAGLLRHRGKGRVVVLFLIL